MRNGMKVTIAAYRPGVEYPWIGWIDGSPLSHSWKEDGSERSGIQSIHDLISPWTSPIAIGHNPDKLTEEQVGVKDGWRLLDEDELCERQKRCCEMWGSGWFEGYGGWHGDRTYRTRLSRSELVALDKPKKRLIRVEELPVVCLVRTPSGWINHIDGRHPSEGKIKFNGNAQPIASAAANGWQWSSDLKNWNSFEVEDK